MRTPTSRYEHISQPFFGFLVYTYYNVTHRPTCAEFAPKTQKEADEWFYKFFSAYVLVHGIELTSPVSVYKVLQEMPTVRLRAKVNALRAFLPRISPLEIADMLGVTTSQVYNILRKRRPDPAQTQTQTELPPAPEPSQRLWQTGARNFPNYKEREE